MNAIRNMKELESVLSSYDSNWQRIIYEATGVILIPHKNGPILFSNCGYIDLDIDAEYSGINGGDNTEYCSILSIDDIIEYILNMPSYHTVLKDVSYGKFSKSELFWSIYSYIIFAEQNLVLSDNPGDIVYGLYSISEYENAIDLNMAAVAYDAITYSIPNFSTITLNEALALLVEQINDTSREIGEPLYSIYAENDIEIPTSYEGLLKKLQTNAEFGWLN